MELDRLKDIRLSGLGRVLHKLVMILTYPFRHIFKFLGLVVVLMVFLAAVPMIQGVRSDRILNWYLESYYRIMDGFGGGLPEIAPYPDGKAPAASEKQALPVAEAEKPVFKEVAAPAVIRKNPVQPAGDNGKFRRKAFKKQTDAETFRRINVAEAPAGKAAVPALKQETAASPRKAESYYRKDDSLPLVYEENPAEISGDAMVFSANDLTVGNNYLFLYGIYTDPEKYDTEKAREYLEQLLQNKTVSCRIVAYTYQNIATGVCFLDGKSINRLLVDAGFADNVAL